MYIYTLKKQAMFVCKYCIVASTFFIVTSAAFNCVCKAPKNDRKQQTEWLSNVHKLCKLKCTKYMRMIYRYTCIFTYIHIYIYIFFFLFRGCAKTNIAQIFAHSFIYLFICIDALTYIRLHTYIHMFACLIALNK